MSQEQPTYVSYLLRLWSIRIDGEKAWRASMESARTGRRQAFTNLEHLFEFIRHETGSASDQTRVDSDEVGDGAP
jgi:hypothetical protein